MSSRPPAVSSSSRSTKDSAASAATRSGFKESSRSQTDPDAPLEVRAGTFPGVKRYELSTSKSLIQLEQDANKLLRIIRDQARRKMLPKGGHMTTWTFNSWASRQPTLRQFWNEAPKLYETHRHLNAALGYDKLIKLALQYNEDLYILCRSDLVYNSSERKWEISSSSKKPLSFYFAGTRQIGSKLEEALKFREAELKDVFNKKVADVFVGPKGSSTVVTENSMNDPFWKKNINIIPAQWMKLKTFVNAYARHSTSKDVYKFIAKHQTIQSHSEGWCNFELLTKDTKWLITRSVFKPWIKAVVSELNSLGIYGVVERVMLLNNNVPADDFTDVTITDKKAKEAGKLDKNSPPRPVNDVAWQLQTIVNAFETSKGPCKKIKFIICAPKSGYKNGAADYEEWQKVREHKSLLPYIIGADWVGPEFREGESGLQFSLKPDGFKAWETVHPAIREIAEKDSKPGRGSWAVHAGELSYAQAKALRPESTTLWGFLSDKSYQPRVIAHGLQAYWQRGSLLERAQALNPLFETTPTSNELLHVIPDFDACPQIFMMRKEHLCVSVNCDNCTQCAITMSDELWKMSLGNFRDLTQSYNPMVCTIWDIKQLIVNSAQAMRQTSDEYNTDMANFEKAWESWLRKWNKALADEYGVSQSRNKLPLR